MSAGLQLIGMLAVICVAIIIKLECLHQLCVVAADVSTQESVMGEFLKTWSETEYTNAGEVMQSVGALQEKNCKTRWEGPMVGWVGGEGRGRQVVAMQRDGDYFNACLK